MNSSIANRFDVYWWHASDGAIICRYKTRTTEDVEYISESHYRVHAHPMDGCDQDPLDLVITCEDGHWKVHSERFEEAGSFPFARGIIPDGFVLTDAQPDELMVIKAFC